MQQVAVNYLNLLSSVRDERSGTGLKLHVDVPFWLDQYNFNWGTYNNTPLHRMVIISASRDSRLMQEQVIDLVDQCHIMDYRDYAYERNATSEPQYNLR